MFKVNYKTNTQGRRLYKRFETITQAQEYCNNFYDLTNIVLMIEKA